MLELLDVSRVWDAAPHCAFSDLIEFDDHFYLVCREGRRHVSTDGAIRILRLPIPESAQAVGPWQSVALLSLAEHDLRDPSLSLMPDGRLMLLAGVAQREKDGGPTRHGTGTAASFSADGVAWSAPEIVVAPGRWIWRAAWNGAVAYGFAYGGVPGGGDLDTLISLYTSLDGRHWSEHAANVLVEGSPTEVALQFNGDGTAYALARRDGEPDSACLGRSSAPYKTWTWSDLGRYLGGPSLLPVTQVGVTRWLAAGRLIEDERAHTALIELDLEQNRLRPLIRLPSGGDTSYPGLLIHAGVLWASYYSSHEGQTCIYLARAKLVYAGC